MAQVTFTTQEAANGGYIISASFYPDYDDDGNGIAQGGDYYNSYRNKNRTYIAKDKDELKALITELLENNIAN